MNLRGKFITDAEGRFQFPQASSQQAIRSRSMGQFAGELDTCAQGRGNMRPAHVHFLINKPGYKTHISRRFS